MMVEEIRKGESIYYIDMPALSGIKHKYLDEIWNNQSKYLGRIVEVHCHEKTPDGSLRHPRLKWPNCLRDTEDRIGDKD